MLLCYLIQSEVSQIRRIQKLNPPMSQQAKYISEYVWTDFSQVRKSHKGMFSEHVFSHFTYFNGTELGILSYITKHSHITGTDSGFFYISLTIH